MFKYMLVWMAYLHDISVIELNLHMYLTLTLEMMKVIKAAGLVYIQSR